MDNVVDVPVTTIAVVSDTDIHSRKNMVLIYMPYDGSGGRNWEVRRNNDQDVSRQPRLRS